MQGCILVKTPASTVRDRKRKQQKSEASIPISLTDLHIMSFADLYERVRSELKAETFNLFYIGK